MNAVIENGKYIRYTSKDRKDLENTIKCIYNEIPEKVIITNSGMNAIYIVLASFVHYAKMILHKKSPVMLFADELYCDTEHDMCKYLKRNCIIVEKFDQQDAKSVLTLVKKYKDNICGIFFEVCSNPHGKNTDFTILSLLPTKCCKIVDNTWLSPVIFNPFNYDIDIVVESCTKYLSGSNQIMGHICCKKYNTPFSKLVDETAYMIGTHVPPVYCKELLHNLQNINERVQSSIHRTKIILQKFEEGKSERIQNIYWSGPKYPSSILLFEIKISEKNIAMKTDCMFNVRKYCEEIVKSTNIMYESSYGKIYDAICSFPRRTLDNTCILLRLSIGHYLHYDDMQKLQSINILYDDMMCIINKI
jgi:cystathionine beta-lyase/cystathionine gamma-synthase